MTETHTPVLLCPPTLSPQVLYAAGTASELIFYSYLYSVCSLDDFQKVWIGTTGRIIDELDYIKSGSIGVDSL